MIKVINWLRIEGHKAGFSLRTVDDMAAVLKLPALLGARSWTARAPGDEGRISALSRMAEAAGAPPTRIMADMARLALGPGRVSFDDYERLRLYDEAFWGGEDRRTVAGARRGRELCRAVNFRRDWFALAESPLASGGYLAAHGLPSAPTLAIFAPGLAAPGQALLRTRGELRQFLTDRLAQPMVARPADGGRARLIFAGGEDPRREVDALIDDLCNSGVRWLFQPRLQPHGEIAAVGGLAPSVRLITIAGDSGVRVFRGYWRLSGAKGVYARLDLKNGRALALCRGAAPEVVTAPPAGLAVPDWAAIRATAGEAARLFGQFGLAGWDIAPTADGPVIVGLTPTPDLVVTQLVDRRGVLDGEFKSFVEARRRLAAEHRALTGD